MEPYRDWIRRLRGTRSVREFAGMLGISQQALQAYEGGQRIPRDEIKRKLEQVSRQQYFFTQKEHK